MATESGKQVSIRFEIHNIWRPLRLLFKNWEKINKNRLINTGIDTPRAKARSLCYLYIHFVHSHLSGGNGGGRRRSVADVGGGGGGGRWRSMCKLVVVLLVEVARIAREGITILKYSCMRSSYSKFSKFAMYNLSVLCMYSLMWKILCSVDQ